MSIELKSKLQSMINRLDGFEKERSSLITRKRHFSMAKEFAAKEGILYHTEHKYNSLYTYSEDLNSSELESFNSFCDKIINSIDTKIQEVDVKIKNYEMQSALGRGE